jgi:tetratricopeptide (TPR) repeat protein
VAGALPALRRPDLAGAAAGAGLLMFAYWLLHSSLDWLWEFPALAGAGLAGLGLATAVRRAPAEDRPGAPLLAGRRALALGIATAVLIAAFVVPPWLSAREVRKGAEIAASDPVGAVEDFDRAADLNPLSPLPQKAAAVVEIRAGRYPEAERHLLEAFKRDNRDSGMYLLLAVLRSSDGRADDARRLIEEAHRLAPHDLVIERAMPVLRRGRKLDPREVDRWIQLDVKERVGGVGAN